MIKSMKETEILIFFQCKIKFISLMNTTTFIFTHGSYGSAGVEAVKCHPVLRYTIITQSIWTDRPEQTV